MKDQSPHLTDNQPINNNIFNKNNKIFINLCFKFINR